MTAGKIASTTEPVTTASASPLLASSLLMAVVRDVSCAALSFSVVRSAVK